jgi:hypothetical protein
MHQLHLKLPIVSKPDYLAGDVGPRAFSRGVVFLVLAAVSWGVVWAVVHVLFKLLGGAQS